MGRTARYCCFHSLEGSGAQHRNSIICGLTLEDCLRDEEISDKVHLLCPSFLNYSVSTPSQTRELKEIQERATKLGRRHDYTIRKLYHIHENSGWNWNAANKKIRDSLNHLEQQKQEETEMKDLLNNIVQTTRPETIVEDFADLFPSSYVVSNNIFSSGFNVFSTNPSYVSRVPSISSFSFPISTSTNPAISHTPCQQAANNLIQTANNNFVGVPMAVCVPTGQPVSRTPSLNRTSSSGSLSRPSVSRTNSASSLLDCKQDFFSSASNVALFHLAARTN